MEILSYAILPLIGFGSGLVIAGAVFAFITAIGVVPRLAQKTRTQEHVKLYESAIALGGIFGAAAGLFHLYIPIGIFVGVLGLCIGVFYGVLAMSLAEVINVIPILARRSHLQRGMFFFVLAIALGKLLGALLYAFIPAFFDWIT